MTDFKKIAKSAAIKTDAHFSDKIASLTRLQGPELQAIMDKSGIDKDALSELLNVVNKSSLSNQQKAAAIAKVNNGLGFLIGVAEKLLI
ncbi:MAG: hypothetical protein IPO83_07920 [Chitinophagaceae bacterium]|nr:hypothetical protein [Chitinophagaceae bacterium]